MKRTFFFKIRCLLLLCMVMVTPKLFADNTVSSTVSHSEKSMLVSDWDLSVTGRFDDGVFLRVSGVVLVLILFLFYRQYMLTRYNQQLKREVERRLEELRKKDEMLLQKLRMAAMGELLSMIAHQWRQPLSAISSTLMSIELRLKLDHYDMNEEEDRKAFFAFLDEKHRKVIEYASFLSHTIEDFRHFFSPHKEQMLLPLTTPVERALRLMHDSFESKEIEIVKEYHSNTEVKMFQNEVMQVILNILKNSEDHFMDQIVEKPSISIETRLKRGEAQITIRDNGGGIPEEIIERIFDPYFSTKEEQQGVGLGLYMSKVIIEKHHHGKLSVKNIEGGCLFYDQYPYGVTSTL